MYENIVNAKIFLWKLVLIVFFGILSLVRFILRLNLDKIFKNIYENKYLVLYNSSKSAESFE
ncbi:hypothetical protein BpHYR1_018619 [Brachionus plicatilis]|uniref:Uncharacterized protein n=1 Tax=Brachionus plicatilis TaxID=10195 RepID=A0A3M7SJD2_BRAPC|nr:hypothetical protein BpHYR1_018619 [Brachionus plicatilis]